MEQYNKIEIRGIVGSVYVKDFGNTKVANMSVATNVSYQTQDGGVCIETTWHRVTAWENKDLKNLDKLQKGCGVHIIGRLRQQKYVASDGTDRIVYDILASKVEIVEQPRESQRV